MLIAALSALVFAATPAELCGKCNEVRHLIERYPVLAREIYEACSSVPANAPCATNADAAVRSAAAVIASERCSGCLDLAASLAAEGDALSAPSAMRLRASCDAIPPEATCAAEASAAVVVSNARLRAIADAHASLARKLSAEEEPYRALEEILRARAIVPWTEGPDLERQTYEQAARKVLDARFEEAVQARYRNDQATARELFEEVRRVSSALGLHDYSIRILDERRGKPRVREPLWQCRGCEDLPQIY